MTEYQVLRHFTSWREAVRAVGLEPNSTNMPLDPSTLLADWGEIVRRIRRIPTCRQYRRDGRYSVTTFDTKFGPWSGIPPRFRKFAEGQPEWADVVALLPVEQARVLPAANRAESVVESQVAAPVQTAARHAKLDNRPAYGNPIDFRGLRHAPVNEQGVVFLFGMVARELGYSVEAIQAGFPDCEAKRQVDVERWQRVRLEFEFESRNFRDHGHSADGCDVIVCWRHNWPECPPNLEVVELDSVLRTLAASEE